MANKKMEEINRIALETFFSNSELKTFIEQHKGECFTGTIRQRDHQPWKVLLYWQKGLVESLEKPIYSTEGGKPVPIIAYCDIDKVTKTPTLYVVINDNYIYQPDRT